LHVFPRLAERVHADSYALQTASGIPAVDQMLADGYWSGTSTMVAGPSGSGKTLMGLHFIFNGAAAGQPGIIATFQESAPQLERIVRGFGWSPGQRIGRADVPLTCGPLSRRMGL
jgi:circadian clock protein KaiC